MITIDRKGWNQLSTGQLQDEVETLASHIEKSGAIVHADTQLKFFAAQCENVYSLEVLEDLNAIILTSIDKGLSESHKISLDKIRILRDQIIAAHPIKDNKVDVHIIGDPLREILRNLAPSEAAKISVVNTKWHKAAQEAQIKAINENQLPICSALLGMTSKQAVEWVLKNPAGKYLEYADFGQMDDFDNECLRTLTVNCPNLRHLFISSRKITGDALKYLANTLEMLSLEISGCTQLEPDALKHLVHAPWLQNLNIEYCTNLQPDALKHLTHAPWLQNLNIEYCTNLEPDALKHLTHTSELQILQIEYCTQLEADALKHLIHTPWLQSLNIGYCTNLETDALKHLKHASELQSLEIVYCDQFEEDALKHLVHTPWLEYLDTTGCDQFEWRMRPHKSKTFLSDNDDAEV